MFPRNISNTNVKRIQQVENSSHKYLFTGFYIGMVSFKNVFLLNDLQNSSVLCSAQLNAY